MPMQTLMRFHAFTLLPLSVALMSSCDDGEAPSSEEELVDAVDEVEEDEAETETEFRGLSLANGLTLGNGLSLANGLTLGNGLSLANGLSTNSGLSTTQGFMTTEAGQDLVKYLVECALPGTSSITKNDPVHGGQRTFQGLVGLAPEWRT